MAITSIYIDSVLPNVAGMKTLDDFNIINWFLGMPAVDATPVGGFYLGALATDLAYNSFNPENPGVINGVLSNAPGYVTVNNTNNLDTNIKAGVTTTICGVMQREAANSLNVHAIADFSGLGSAAYGFSIGFGSSGYQLFMAGQNLGQSTANYAYANLPETLAVGSMFAFAASITNNALTVSVYDAATDTVLSGSGALSGTRVAGDKNIIIGAKQDNNSNNTAKHVKSTIILDGLLTTEQRKNVLKYLLNMA